MRKVCKIVFQSRFYGIRKQMKSSRGGGRGGGGDWKSQGRKEGKSGGKKSLVLIRNLLAASLLCFMARSMQTISCCNGKQQGNVTTATTSTQEGNQEGGGKTRGNISISVSNKNPS